MVLPLDLPRGHADVGHRQRILDQLDLLDDVLAALSGQLEHEDLPVERIRSLQHERNLRIEEAVGLFGQLHDLDAEQDPPE